MDAGSPVTATRSRPVMRSRRARAASRGWCYEGASGLTRGTGRNGSSRSKRGVITTHCRAIWASHAARGGVSKSPRAQAGGSIHHC